MNLVWRTSVLSTWILLTLISAPDAASCDAAGSSVGDAAAEAETPRPPPPLPLPRERTAGAGAATSGTAPAVAVAARVVAIQVSFSNAPCCDPACLS